MVHRISLHYFLHLHVNLQLSLQKKNFALNDYVRLDYFWVIFYTWNSMIWGV